jgi:RNA polymerase sigma-B factor
MLARESERVVRERRTSQVLEQLDRVPDGSARDALIADLIEINMGLAESIASRYRHRGISDEDLQQVAYLALARVAHRYDHSTGHDFLSYAVPSIRGEIRRHFRDRGWMVRPPRRVQELQGRISAVEPELAGLLGHPPTATDLALELDVPETDVDEALAATGCFTPTSLDLVVGSTDRTSLGDQLGEPETGLDAVEARVMLAPVVRRLTSRERRILELRFFGGCTQQEIADDIGVTQMQVSRLLQALLARLRRQLQGDADLPTAV